MILFVKEDKTVVDLSIFQTFKVKTENSEFEGVNVCYRVFGSGDKINISLASFEKEADAHVFLDNLTNKMTTEKKIRYKELFNIEEKYTISCSGKNNEFKTFAEAKRFAQGLIETKFADSINVYKADELIITFY